jgi:anti-sigma-K factor RskA
MRVRATRQFATSAACILVCFSTACSTLSPVAVDAAGERIRTEIKVGDTVRVLTAAGTTHSFHIRQIELQQVSGWKTAAIVAAAAVAAAVAIESGGGSHTVGYNG